MKIGFDNQKYQTIQSEHIKERISQFDGKLYLELGGKLFDDHHASRVLPGFQPDSKLRMFQKISDSIEIVIVISAADIDKNKKRADLGITYDEDVLRLRGEFQRLGFMVGSVVITHYNGQPAAIAFRQRLERDGIATYCHYLIEGYPHNVSLIASEEGFGKNDYVKTSRPLVIVTAPGPGSGKMAVCLSQLYNEHKHGVRAGYAKFETFPVWNLPLKHPVNIAYEAATSDLSDSNMIDPFHLEAYGQTTVNYNRDVEIFPVLRTIFERIYGECPYKSPTDMGVNMVGLSIVDDEVCREASRQEIIRRYFKAACQVRQGLSSGAELSKIELLMSSLNLEPEERAVVPAALGVADRTGKPAAAIELPDGAIVTGKTTDLFGPVSAAMLNALKALAGIPDEIKLISPEVIGTIQTLKTDYMKSQNPRLHTDEMLVALAISAASDENAMRAMQKINELNGCEVHCSVILSSVDDGVFKRLNMHLTCEPTYEKNNLYHK